MTDAEKAVADAQKDLADTVKQAKNATVSVAPDKGPRPSLWSPQLVCKLSLGIGFFGVFTIALVAVLLFQRRNAEQILRTFGILVIVIASVFLVIAGYSNDQITPVIGLLGTIAGYLLGRRIEPNGDGRKNEHQKPG